MKWRVVRNDDIADPYIVVRNIKDPGNIAYEVTLPYFERSFQIDMAANITRRKRNDAEYQVCLLARDSKTFIRGFHMEQCKSLPKNSALVLSFAPNCVSLITMIACFMQLV